MNSPILANSGGDSDQRWLRLCALFLGLIFGGMVLTFCLFASSFCITIILSAFLAILFEPLVARIARIGLGRTIASALVVMFFMLAAVVLIYAFYNKAMAFADQFPIYASRIQHAIAPVATRIQVFEKNAQAINPIPAVDGGRRVPEVTVKEPAMSWPSFLIRGMGSISGVLIVAGVIPFLVFFMLVSKEQMSIRFVNMFERSIDVPKFLGNLDNMIRGFVVGNLIVGSIMAVGTSIVLVALGMQNAVSLGIASAFLNLIPFVGMLLAAALPMAAALLQFSTITPYVTIGLTVMAFHLIAANYLIPKIVGSRLLVGPVAVTVGMLFWGWLWGIVGLLLAVPLTAFVKLIADSHPSLIHLANLLTEHPRPIPRWARFGEATIQRVRPYFNRRPAVAAGVAPSVGIDLDTPVVDPLGRHPDIPAAKE